MRFINSLTFRLFFLVTGLLVTLIFALTINDAYMTSKFQTQRAYDRMVAAADFSGRNLEPHLRSKDLPTLNNAMSAINDMPNVLFANVYDTALNHEISGQGTIPFTLKANPSGNALAVLKGANRTVEFGKHSLTIYEPLEWGNDTLGVLVISYRVANFNDLAILNLRQNLLAGAPIILIGSILALWLAFQITRPIRKLSDYALKAEGGNFDAQMPVAGTTETQHLGRAFQVMIDDLRKSLKTSALYAEESRTAAKKAQTASKAKSEFLANMSHEIRTPMNGVIGLAEILLKTDLDSKQKELAEIIMSSGNSLIIIINDILDFSKIEAGKMRLIAEPMNLRIAIQDIMALITVKARDKNLDLRVQYDPTLPEGFLGDAGRIRQIITNLIGNAVKFTDQGYIEIRVRGKQHATNVKICIEVEDTGIGISEDCIDKIFDQFEQEDTTSTRKYQGTGIGLAISKSLVELMGGTIGVHSTPGKGSTFWFEITLPVAHSIIEKHDKKAPSLVGMHVLVVDGNKHSKKILFEQIENWGMSAITVENATAGLLELAKSQKKNTPFDLVITDYNIPGTNGVIFTKEMREQSIDYQGPVLILSSLPEQPGAEASARDMSSLWLTKPVRASQLMDAIAISIYEHSVKALQTTAKTLSATSKPETKQTTQPLNILVAEDNKVNQMVLTAMLADFHATIRLANNGLQVVEAFSNAVPDLIIMDISMPEMDGMEATRAIRQREVEQGLPRTPIIAATAHVLEAARQRCLDAGMDDVITKPVKQAVLEKAIQRCLKDSANLAAKQKTG